MRRIRMLAALLTVGLSATAHASDDDLGNWEPTGNILVAACREDQSGHAADTTECYAYIHGALDGFFVGSIWELPASGGFVPELCVPDKVTNNEIRKVILLYADKHPEKLHMMAAAIVANAVEGAWGMSSKGHKCP